MKKRRWCYAQYPKVYDVYCDLCGSNNTTWSEFQRHIWCFDCKKDTRGTGGIFDGPVAIGLCNILGVRFDRINLKTGKIMKQERWLRVKTACRRP